MPNVQETIISCFLKPLKKRVSKKSSSKIQEIGSFPTFSAVYQRFSADNLIRAKFSVTFDGFEISIDKK